MGCNYENEKKNKQAEYKFGFDPKVLSRLTAHENFSGNLSFAKTTLINYVITIFSTCPGIAALWHTHKRSFDQIITTL
jgi:hypothetical protein